MEEKLELNKLKKRNESFNKFWIKLINQEIQSTVKKAYCDEVQAQFCNKISEDIQHKVVQSGLKKVVQESTQHEHNGVAISSQLGDDVMKSLLGKIAK